MFSSRNSISYIKSRLRRILICLHGFFILVCFLSFSGTSFGQSPFPPPNQLQVFATQELNFGSFFAGSTGGEVIVSPEGSRSTTGSVMELALSPGMPAIFDVRLIPGRIVHISFPQSAMLTRIGSSESIMISGFMSDKQGNYFVTTSAHPFINPVKVGATLHVGGGVATRSGDYVGSFTVTFVQE